MIVKRLASFISLLLLPMQLFALGFRDIDVNSSIGEPLVATIMATDVSRDSLSSCLEVRAEDGIPSSDLSFNISNLEGGKALIRITSKHAVQEPILNIVVNNACESLSRHYTVLLDLPSTTVKAVEPVNTKKIDLPPVLTPSALHVENQTKVSESKHLNKDELAVTDLKASTAKKSDNRDSLSSAETKSKDSKQARTSTSAKTVTKSTADENLFKPRLSMQLSAESMLSLDTSLDMDSQTATEPTLQAVAKTTPAPQESQQELIALKNQLAQMQQQLAHVQATQNQQVAPTQVSVLKQHIYQVLAGLFIILLTILAASKVDWKNQWARIRNKNEEDSYIDLDALNMQHHTHDEVFETDDEDFDIPEHNIYRPTNSEGLIEFEMHDAVPELKTVLAQATSISTPTSVKDDLVDFEDSYEHLEKVKEIVAEQPSLIEEASVYLEYGRNALAIQLLYEHLLDYPKESAANWLYLLDLLAKEERVEAYEVIATECRRHFNVQLSPYSKPKDGTNKLASYERIINHLQEVSGTPEAVAFLDELIYNTRLEARLGFDQSIFEELIELRAINHEAALKDPAYIAQLEEAATFKSPLAQLDLPLIEPSEAFINLGQQFGHDTDKYQQQKKSVDSFNYELADLKHR